MAKTGSKKKVIVFALPLEPLDFSTKLTTTEMQCTEIALVNGKLWRGTY